MLELLLKDRAAIERMRAGLFGPHLDAVAASLVGAGYVRSTARAHLWLIADFERWLTRRGVLIGDVDERAVSLFLAKRKKGRSHRCYRAALHRVVNHLRAEGIISELVRPVSNPTPIDRLIGRFEDYLRTECAVLETTVAGYRPFVRSFLDERFGRERVLLAEVQPADVSRFLLRWAPRVGARARLLVTGLRSFFRFLLWSGEIDVDLSGCVLSMAMQRSTVPRHLGQEEVERLLRACDQSSSHGRRDYALLLLLARLGLRATEVMALELGDVDWRAGEIMVRGKGLTRERLPLPADVGEALVAYLRQDRPGIATRQVFACTRAPHRGFANPSTVSTIVRRALVRAGLRPAVWGAHLLRHSLATGMLRRGASLTEIGQILRHRTRSATEVYAKVDFASLRSVALPWPRRGGAR